MKVKGFILSLFAVLVLSSCVSSKRFDNLKTGYKGLEKENEYLRGRMQRQKDDATHKTTDYQKLTAERNHLTSELEDINRKRDNLQKRYDQLRDSYSALENSSSGDLEEKSKQNRELLSQIEAKQEKLEVEESRLEKLKEELGQRGDRIVKLKETMAAKEKQMKDLKENISSALTDFEGDGLHVRQKEGKVYVSMEDKLLFDTGRWNVNSRGQRAIKQLGEVLGQSKDIDVLIEGHTDNVPYRGSGLMRSNWDLSTKRSISFVEILMESEGIDPRRLTVAGRSEYDPVAENKTSEGRAKNRRLEVILTPSSDKVSELLNSN